MSNLENYITQKVDSNDQVNIGKSGQYYNKVTKPIKFKDSSFQSKIREFLRQLFNLIVEFMTWAISGVNWFLIGIFRFFKNGRNERRKVIQTILILLYLGLVFFLCFRKIHDHVLYDTETRLEIKEYKSHIKPPCMTICLPGIVSYERMRKKNITSEQFLDVCSDDGEENTLEVEKCRRFIYEEFHLIPAIERSNVTIRQIFDIGFEINEVVKCQIHDGRKYIDCSIASKIKRSFILTHSYFAMCFSYFIDADNFVIAKEVTGGNWPIKFSILLDKSRLDYNHLTPVEVFLHNKHNLPSGYDSLGIKLDKEKAHFIHFHPVEIERLPPPYDTMCYNYRDHPDGPQTQVRSIKRCIEKHFYEEQKCYIDNSAIDETRANLNGTLCPTFTTNNATSDYSSVKQKCKNLSPIECHEMDYHAEHTSLASHSNQSVTELYVLYDVSKKEQIILYIPKYASDDLIADLASITTGITGLSLVTITSYVLIKICPKKDDEDGISNQGKYDTRSDITSETVIV